MTWNETVTFTHAAVIKHLKDIVNDNYSELEKIYWSLPFFNACHFYLILKHKFEIEIRK